jgi:hypothetical protein
VNRTEYIRRLRMDLIKELDISEQIIEEAFGPNSHAEFEKHAVAEFDKFSDTIPFFKDRNNQDNFSFGPVLLAAYRTMTIQYACTEARAMEVLGHIIEHVTRHDMEHRNPALKFAYGKVGKYAFLRKILAGYFNYKQEPLGWEATFRHEKDAYVAADMTACGLFQWFSLNKSPQLCSLACASDYITMEYTPHLKLERKETISNGDPVCSFRYISKA